MNEEQLGQIIAEHYGRLWAYCYTILRDADLADDAVQETFIELYKARNTFTYRSEGELLAWLYKVALRKCIAIKRKHQKLSPTETGFLEALVADDDQVGEWNIAEVIGLLRNELAPELWSVLEAFYLEGSTYSQIAEVLDLRLGTVKTRLRKSRLEARKILSDFLHDDDEEELRLKHSRQLDEIRKVSLAGKELSVLKFEAVDLPNGAKALIAYAITAKGSQEVIDLQLGDVHDQATSDALIDRLEARSLNIRQRTLVICHPSPSLQTVVKERLDDPVLQLCLDKSEQELTNASNDVLGLPAKNGDTVDEPQLTIKEWKSAIAEQFQDIRAVSNSVQLRDTQSQLEETLRRFPKFAANGLFSDLDNLFSVFKLELPNDLVGALTTSNLYQQKIKNRDKSGQMDIPNCPGDTQESEYWLGYILSQMNREFRSIPGYHKLDELTKALDSG